MTSRPEWRGTGTLLAICIVAVVLTAWQVQVDRSVFEPYFGAVPPVGVMVGTTVVGMVAMVRLQGTSDFAVLGPGAGKDVVRMSFLKEAGLFSATARDGLPIATAGSVGVTPRAGTDVGALPDPLPLSIVLADHRADDISLFIYPWCESPE